MVTAVAGMVAPGLSMWFFVVQVAARRVGELSETQLAELAGIPRCSVEPVRKRLRVLSD